MAPWREWTLVAHEPTTARDIYLGYVAPLAAIGAIAPFVANTVIGVDTGPTHVRAAFRPGLLPSSSVTRSRSLPLRFSRASW